MAFLSVCLFCCICDAVLPQHDPIIIGLQPQYAFGDFVQADCMTDKSSPPATISWTINDVPVSIEFCDSFWYIVWSTIHFVSTTNSTIDCTHRCFIIVWFAPFAFVSVQILLHKLQPLRYSAVDYTTFPLQNRSQDISYYIDPTNWPHVRQLAVRCTAVLDGFPKYSRHTERLIDVVVPNTLSNERLVNPKNGGKYIRAYIAKYSVFFFSTDYPFCVFNILVSIC